MTTPGARSAPDVTVVLLVDPRQATDGDVAAARTALGGPPGPGAGGDVGDAEVRPATGARQVVVGDVVAAGGRGRAMAVGAERATGGVVVFVDAAWGADAAPVVDRMAGALVADGGAPIPDVLVVGQPPPESPEDSGTDGALVGGTLDVLLRPVVELLVPGLAWLRRPLDAPVALPRSLLRTVVFGDGPAAGLDLVVTVATAGGTAAVLPVTLEGRWIPQPPVDDPGGLAGAVFEAVLPRVTGPVPAPAPAPGGTRGSPGPLPG